MTRKLLPNTEILRVITLAQEVGLTIAGLDVGTDYVRVITPAQGGDSVEQYIRPTHRAKKAGDR